MLLVLAQSELHRARRRAEVGDRLPELAQAGSQKAGAKPARTAGPNAIELEQALNAYADRCATHMVAATGAIERDNPSAEQRRMAHLVKLGTISSMYDIATERDVFNRLLDMVQGREAHLFDRAVDNQVSRLRRKMEADSRDPKLIQTVWGGGYRLAADVRRVAPDRS